MAIDVSTLSTRPLDPVIDEELVKFEEGVRQYLAGEIEEDVFRVFRLNQGIYGQRQGGHNQMVRVKVPHGSLVPEQLEMLGYLADEYSRGWAATVGLAACFGPSAASRAFASTTKRPLGYWSM